MKKVSFADVPCSVAQSLEVIGEWWTLLILRDAFLGVTRFDDFAARLGISRNVLTARLDTLVDNDVLTRVPYDQARGRYDYRLTDKGRALLPVLTAIRQWGDEWIVGTEHAPVVLEHADCGKVTQGVLTCAHCGEELTARNVRARRGPGATDDSLLPSAD
ncbi:MAG: winged helix-turn-helix transcriptional regulator [Acidimicrobiales bacterium]